jgi:hypothetical protein
MIALVLADILLPLIVPLGASAFLLVGVPTLVLVAVLAVLSEVVGVIVVLLLGALGDEVAGLAAVVAGLPSCLLVVEGALEIVDDQCKFLDSQHVQLLICISTREDKQKPPREKSVFQSCRPGQ